MMTRALRALVGSDTSTPDPAESTTSTHQNSIPGPAQATMPEPHLSASRITSHSSHTRNSQLHSNAGTRAPVRRNQQSMMQITMSQVRQLRRDMQSLSDELQRCQQQAMSYEEDAEFWEREASDWREGCTYWHRESTKLVSSNAQLQNRLDRTEQGLARREELLKTREELLKTKEAEIQHHKQQIALGRKDLDETRRQLESCKSAFGSKIAHPHSNWPQDEDVRLQQLIHGFYRSLRAWAKKYATASLDSLPMGSLMQGGLMIEYTGEAVRINGVESITATKSPFLIVAALLSEDIRLQIFSNPFFIFRDPVEEGSQLHQRLYSFYQDIMDKNPSGAHLWRTLLFRSAFPDFQTSAILPVEPNLPKNTTRDKIEQVYSVMRDGFADSLSASLLRPMSTEEGEACKRELIRLYIQAGNLQTRLQTHRAFFQWAEPVYCVGEQFKVGSPYFKADRIHGLEDDEDTSHDGHGICLVLSPPVVVSGDQHGDNYDKQRTIAKGIVVLQAAQRSEDTQPVTKVKSEDEEMKDNHLPDNDIPGSFPGEVKWEV